MAAKKSKNKVDKNAATRAQGKAARRALDRDHETDLLVYAGLCVIDTEIARVMKLGCKVPKTVVKAVGVLVAKARTKTLLRKSGNRG